jgi:hypothetical protein
MIYIGHYIYIAPEGTFDPEERSQPYESLVKVSSSLDDVIEYIADNFDGLETFREKFEPEIRERLVDGEIYFGDDWSAGQWFRVTKIDDDSPIDASSEL